MFLLTTLYVNKLRNLFYGKELISKGRYKWNEESRLIHGDDSYCMSEKQWEQNLDRLDYDSNRKRLVGIFEKFEDAENVIKENICDICECNYYNIAIIEEVDYGMYPYPKREEWYTMESKFQYRDENGYHYDYNWKKIDKPKVFKDIVCWY